jgi:hypothetical protein
MSSLLALMLAAAPATSLSLSGDLTYAAGFSPANGIGLAAGTRFTFHHVSLGVEFQFLPPGAHVVDSRELPVAPLRGYTVGSQGIGGMLHVPLCYQFGAISACGVGTVGAINLRSNASRDGTFHPLVSAGARLSGEFPRDSKVRMRASAQVLGGLVRPTDGFWEASPVQLGLTLGLIVDAL